MITEKECKAWNVIFLVDQVPPTKAVLLKRAGNKSFAPNMYTGIGGKIELNEDPLASANREMQEETGLRLPLTEFARVHIKPDLMLYYFYGLFSGDLPKTADGSLEWIITDEILSRDIIPTTKRMMEEWKKRDFAVDKPYTVILQESEPVDGIRSAKVLRAEEGLREL